ncbi:golgin subfamily A member 6-like protein 6 [Sinocyclocheilus grahami]|uniref:golgin subfamily A member 6-like protein 6 n=1 Tax=Sinocyclocheilus grahami TaxID=75366 RepID=UPI0007ACEF40|nr:PREDICTED: golgin subfamily A member 6-like protein 6 [Sinocyclocheilus grahami]
MEGIVREKERIERETQEQLEDSEKRLKEERNMREDQQKTLEEQHEEELKRRRVQWREEYEREEEEEKKKKICSETGPSLQGENRDIEPCWQNNQRSFHAAAQSLRRDENTSEV